jgi:hypothetical protein
VDKSQDKEVDRPRRRAQENNWQTGAMMRPAVTKGRGREGRQAKPREWEWVAEEGGGREGRADSSPSVGCADGAGQMNHRGADERLLDLVAESPGLDNVRDIPRNAHEVPRVIYHLRES